MEDKTSQISDRLLDYGVAVIKICIKLKITNETQQISAIIGKSIITAKKGR